MDKELNVLCNMLFLTIILTTATVTWADKHCSLNGVYHFSSSSCLCDPGWKGLRCSELDLAPTKPANYGLHDDQMPSWGGGAVFHDKRWHLIVGARAQDWPNLEGETDYSKTDYLCDSKIVRAVSATSDPSGPYKIIEEIVPRTSWEPSLTISPTGELILMFVGNMTNPPPVGSQQCVGLESNLGGTSEDFNITSIKTYIAVSHSGSPIGPWTEPHLVKGMENKAWDGSDPYRWSCISGNPSPAYHPNGTLFAAMRHNPCWKGFNTREHIGLWRADEGWDGTWTLVTKGDPIFGWGNGNQEDCHDTNDCPSHEDPHLWIDARGFHLLTHTQNNPLVQSKRGAYGWSLDGHHWTLETGPLMSNASAWDLDLRWTNGTTTTLARRQRVSFIRDPVTMEPTHIINGADFTRHLNSSFCEGCHWGQGFTLITPLNRKKP